MAVLYYKFKSTKEFTEFPICERYISVREFKTSIFESKIGRGRDFDLIITNADTGEDYDLESSMILANTKLLLRRIPGLPPMAIVVGAPAAAAAPVESVQIEQPKSADIIKDSEWNEIFASISGSNSSSSSFSTLTTVDDSVFQPNSGTIQTTVPRTEIIETPKDTRKITVNVPPNGYICYRCNIAGHFIQHCPTNGDPNYDIKRMKVAGFPMEKEVKKIPSNANNNNNIPFEFYCKLCTNIMENSVMTRCCFASFCEKCIKNFIFSNFKCFCGVTNIINDHLLPNITLRKIIMGRIDNNESKVLSSELSENNTNDETCMVVSSRAAPKRKLYEHRNDMHGHMKKFKSGSDSKPFFAIGTLQHPLQYSHPFTVFLFFN